MCVLICLFYIYTLTHLRKVLRWRKKLHMDTLLILLPSSPNAVWGTHSHSLSTHIPFYWYTTSGKDLVLLFLAVIGIKVLLKWWNVHSGIYKGRNWYLCLYLYCGRWGSLSIAPKTTPLRWLTISVTCSRALLLTWTNKLQKGATSPLHHDQAQSSTETWQFSAFQDAGGPTWLQSWLSLPLRTLCQATKLNSRDTDLNSHAWPLGRVWDTAPTPGTTEPFLNGLLTSWKSQCCWWMAGLSSVQFWRITCSRLTSKHRCCGLPKWMSFLPVCSRCWERGNGC